jgi:hypothetical protein
VIVREREEQETRELLADPRRKPPSRRLTLAQMLEEESGAPRPLGFETGGHAEAVIGAGAPRAHP